MKTRFKTREALLQDTIDYYWDKPERKCTTKYGVCQYSATETSEGCAIGRLVSKTCAKKLDSIGSVLNGRLFFELPKWLQGMDFEFLEALQSLHDGGYLSHQAKEVVIEKMDCYVDMSKIKFPENLTN